MAIAESVRRYLAENEVPFEVLSHPHSGSSHETALAAHVPEDHLAKAVILRDELGYLMAVIRGDTWLRMERLREELNRPNLALMPELELGGLFADCELGAVPPLPAAYAAEAVVDEDRVGLGRSALEVQSGDVHVDLEERRLTEPEAVERQRDLSDLDLIREVDLGERGRESGCGPG